MSDSTSFLNVGVLFCTGLLIMYIIVAHLIEENKVDFLHESGVAVLMGSLAGLVAFLVYSFYFTTSHYRSQEKQ